MKHNNDVDYNEDPYINEEKAKTKSKTPSPEKKKNNASIRQVNNRGKYVSGIKVKDPMRRSIGGKVHPRIILKDLEKSAQSKQAVQSTR